MLEDQTVIKPIAQVQINLLVNVVNAQGKPLAQQLMARSFSVGRSRDNDIQIDDEIVSRKHLVIKLEPDGWWLHHLNSTNGVYINGRRIADKEKLTLPVSIGLGKSGLTLMLQYQHEANGFLRAQVGAFDQGTNRSRSQSPEAIDVREQRLPADFEARLLEPEDTNDMDEFTLMMRRVIRQDRVAQSKRYWTVIWLLAGLVTVILGLASYEKWLW